MPRAQRGVAVNNTISEINILNIFALSSVLSCCTGPGSVEGKGWAGAAPRPRGKADGVQLAGTVMELSWGLWSGTARLSEIRK